MPALEKQTIKLLPCIQEKQVKVFQKCAAMLRKKKGEVCQKVTEYDDRVNRLISDGDQSKESKRMSLKQMRAYHEKCAWNKEHNFSNLSSVKI